MKRHIRRPALPLGSADCFKTRFSGNRSKCGAKTAKLHVPRLVPGKFCERCCRACNAPEAQPSEMPTEQPKSTGETR